MKSFKILFVCFCMVFSSVAFSQSVIGRVVNGTPTFTTDVNRLINNWQKILSTQSSIQTQLNSIKIELINGAYYLMASGTPYSSAILLNCAVATGDLTTSSISCTSKTCATSDGCIPNKDGKSCTSCGWGTGDCTKTVSSLVEMLADY